MNVKVAVIKERRNLHYPNHCSVTSALIVSYTNCVGGASRAQSVPCKTKVRAESRVKA